jgi:hypothetical protein
MANLTWDENLFLAVGLDTPFKRFAAGVALTTSILFAFKPANMYDVAGHTRGWKLISGGEEDTWLPWWILPLAVGGTLAIFV